MTCVQARTQPLTLFLATFLLNNYKQARQIIDESPKALASTMKELGISGEGVFETWLQEEKTYLQGLKKEPEGETLQMEYYQKLTNLWASQ